MMTNYLLGEMPTVVRARNFRLYANGGRRLVDLWQNGGAAILGHTPPSLLKTIKNTAGRGLYAPFPHFTEKRYLKALAHIFPGRDFRLYASPPPFLAELIAAGTAALWRPFGDPAAPLAVPANAPPVLIPVVPSIQGWRDDLPCGLCALAVAPDFAQTDSLPPGDFLSPVLLAAAARGIYDLIAAAPLRAQVSYPRITRALTNNPAGEYFWHCQGVYITPLPGQTLSPETWAALFRRFLENGFLLPPVSSQPVILPGELSSGEEAKLSGLFSV